MGTKYDWVGLAALIAGVAAISAPAHAAITYDSYTYLGTATTCCQSSTNDAGFTVQGSGASGPFSQTGTGTATGYGYEVGVGTATVVSMSGTNSISGTLTSSVSETYVSYPPNGSETYGTAYSGDTIKFTLATAEAFTLSGELLPFIAGSEALTNFDENIFSLSGSGYGYRAQNLNTNGQGGSAVQLAAQGVLAAGTYTLNVTSTVDPHTLVDDHTWPTIPGTVYTDSSGIDFALNLTPVPLPAAAWLMLSGLSGLGALALKKRDA